MKKKKSAKRKWSGAASRRKGHQFERWVAEQFRKTYPEARRQLEYHADDAKGIDITNVGAYRPQCKRGRRYASLTAIEEIQICPIEGGVPVLITKGDDKEPLACMPFKHFLWLVAERKRLAMGLIWTTKKLAQRGKTG
jgi:hypothetical protein